MLSLQWVELSDHESLILSSKIVMVDDSYGIPLVIHGPLVTIVQSCCAASLVVKRGSVYCLLSCNRRYYIYTMSFECVHNMARFVSVCAWQPAPLLPASRYQRFKGPVNGQDLARGPSTRLYPIV